MNEKDSRYHDDIHVKKRAGRQRETERETERERRERGEYWKLRRLKVHNPMLCVKFVTTLPRSCLVLDVLVAAAATTTTTTLTLVRVR